MNAQLDSVRRFTAGRARPVRRPARAGHVVVVGAGKGGVGTSTVAALLAHAAATRGPALLVDAVPAAGGQAALLDVPAGPGIAGLRAGNADPREVLVPVAERWHLVPAGVSPGSGEPAPSAAEWRILVRRLASLWKEFDTVVIDGGCRLDTVAAALEAGGGALVAVTEPGRVAVAAAYALLKAVRARFPDVLTDVVVNRAEDPEARGVARVLAAALDRFLETTMDLAGAVPQDPALAAAIEAGSFVRLTPDTSRALAAARDVQARLAMPAPGGPHAAGPVLVRED